MVTLEIPKRDGSPTSDRGSNSGKREVQTQGSTASIAGSGSSNQANNSTLVASKEELRQASGLAPDKITSDPSAVEQLGEDETLESLLATLTASHSSLKREKAKEESQRAAAARRAASERAGRFVGGKPWRCPCSFPEQFNAPERLPPGRFFKPFEAAIVDRPARAYEHIDGPPFMAYDSNSRAFGEAPPILSPKSKLAAAGSISLNDPAASPKKASPRQGSKEKRGTLLGDSIGVNAGRKAGADRQILEQKSPRAAKLQGMLASPAGPRWHAATACPRELNHWDFLQERVVAPPGARMGGPFTSR